VTTLLSACPICSSLICRAYASGLPRRYCSQRCVKEAQRLWFILVNRRFRLSAIEAPTCRLPEVERLTALAAVREEIADLEGRLGVGQGRPREDAGPSEPTLLIEFPHTSFRSETKKGHRHASEAPQG
jgi:hypothetical protein